MIYYHDTTLNSVLIERIIDNGDGTGHHYKYDNDGNEIYSQAISGLEVRPEYPPLDSIGALATLLVVEGVLNISDAANALHEEPAHLEHEAIAWSLG